MIAVDVVVPGQLREFCGGRADVRVSGDLTSVREALALFWRECPGARDRVLTELGEVRPHINVFVDGENIRYTGGLSARVRDGSEIIILPAVSGGAPGPGEAPLPDAAYRNPLVPSSPVL